MNEQTSGLTAQPKDLALLDDFVRSFLDALEARTSWGRNELRAMLYDCEREAIRRHLVRLEEARPEPAADSLPDQGGL